MADARRLIFNRGRPLVSHYGRLVAAPFTVIPDPSTSDSISLGDGATGTITARVSTSDAFGLGDGVSSNPPSAGVSDSISLGDGAAVSRIHRPSVSDSIALGDGAVASVESPLTTTNNGPYPRLNATQSGALYDSTGKSFVTAVPGAGQFSEVTGVTRTHAAGITETGIAMLNDAGGLFALANNGIAVKSGRAIGVAGSVYDISLYIGTSDGGSHERFMRITAQDAQTPPPRTGVDFTRDFNAMSLGAVSDMVAAGFTTEGLNSFTVIDDGTRRCLRMTLVHGGQTGQAAVRSEIIPRVTGANWSGTSYPGMAHGVDYFFGWKQKLAGWSLSEIRDDIFMQIHGFDAGAETGRNPNFSLLTRYRSGTPQYTVNVKSQTLADGGTSYNTNVVQDIGQIAADVGVWVDWVVQYRAAHSSAGINRVWRNGVLVYEQTTLPNAFNDPGANGAGFVKFGIYKWDWASGSGSPDRVIYIDDLRIASGATATYTSVAP